MPTLHIGTAAYEYLRRAMKRDLGQLEEMAPWDIDGHDDEHAAEMRLCQELSALLAVECSVTQQEIT